MLNLMFNFKIICFSHFSHSLKANFLNGKFYSLFWTFKGLLVDCLLVSLLRIALVFLCLISNGLYYLPLYMSFTFFLFCSVITVKYLAIDLRRIYIFISYLNWIKVTLILPNLDAVPKISNNWKDGRNNTSTDFGNTHLGKLLFQFFQSFAELFRGFGSKSKHSKLFFCHCFN